MTLYIIFGIIILAAILFVVIGYASNNSSNSEMNTRIQSRINELNNEKITKTIKNKSSHKKIPKSIEDEFLELERKTEDLRRKNKDFSIAFNEIASKMKKAKSLEKSNIYAAISLYEECLNATAGNFCPEERLVILYSKTHQLRNEIEMCKILMRKQAQHYNKWKLRLDKLATR